MVAAMSAPSFFERFVLAWVAYFRVLFDASYAARVKLLASGAAVPRLGASGDEPSADEAHSKKEAKPVDPKPADPTPVDPKPVDPKIAEAELALARRDGALLFLGALQREGRLVDFLKQDIEDFKDDEIGVAVRVVHAGCKKLLGASMTIASVRAEEEGAKLTVDPERDDAVKLVGNVRGKAPFQGVLRHRGWRATDISLPAPVKDHDATVLCPAEVEL